MNLEKIREINQHAMLEASRALSKLMQGPVKLGAHHVEVKRADELPSALPSDEIVLGLASPLSSDTQGNSLLILPIETGKALCDLLLKRDRGSTQNFGQEETALLEEVANIIVGNYLRTFSVGTGLKCVLHGVAGLHQDKFPALISKIIPNTSAPEQAVLPIEILFTF